jgi:tetratricopeptide (TPR) repeat protein
MRLLRRLRVFAWRPNRDGTAVRPLLAGSLIFVFLSVWADTKPGFGQAITFQHGIPHQESLGTGQPLAFAFEALAGTSYLVEVDQGGLDLVLTIQSPAGVSQSFNSPLLRDESELAIFDAAEKGRYTLVLESHEYSGAIAHPVIKISELPPQSGKERDQLAGLHLLSEASAADHQSSVEGRKLALQSYDQAASLFRKTGDDHNLARCLYSAATIEYWHQSQWGLSASLAEEAAELYRRNGDERLAANAVHLQAAALVEKALEVEKSDSNDIAPEALALFDQALELLRQAEEALQRLQFPYDAARVTNNFGYTYLMMEEFDTAVPYFDRAAEQFRAMKEWQDELNPVSNLANIDREQANLVRAVETWQRQLELLPEDRDRRARADINDNLAAAQLALHRLTDALKSYSRGLEIHRQIDDINGQSYSLAGLGTTYYSLGQHELALEYTETALKAAEETNNGATQTSTLKFIGRIKRLAGDGKGALQAHSRALQLATGPMNRANIRLEICEDLLVLDRPGEALKMLGDTQALVDEFQNPLLHADFLRVSGATLLQSGRPADALEAYRQAADRYQNVGLAAQQSRALFGQARAARALDDSTAALEHTEQAIAAVEQLRGQLVAPEFRSFFLAARQDYYAFLIDILMELHANSEDGSDQHLMRALSISERSRARALIDLISEASIQMKGAGFEALNERQARLYEQMATRRFQLDQLLDQPGSGNTEKRILEIRQELAGIENQVNLLRIELREKNPTYASLTDPEILEADSIREMLDGETVLLQYALGPENSYVWRVTRDSIEGIRLAGREEIEREARSLYALLQVPGGGKEHLAELSQRIARLSGLVLRPAGPLPQGKVLVVADGVLHYLPFSVLLSPSGFSEPESMLASHELISVPSMSVLATQRQIHLDQRRPGRELAVFADPVFGSDDPRLTEPGNGAAVQPALPRLPATAQEARSIAGLVAPDQQLLALGFDANLDAVMNTQLRDYRIIHFATHGRIDSRYPALSELVFSQVDENGQPREGSLHLHDIYNLDLQADLVAMSACSTALGREIAGEGLTGLTQGFMYAGSRSVLASLWQVPDRATAELMTRFYRNLLEGEQTPSAALRQAQLELASKARWRSPYYWGAFILQGEWK